MTALSVSLFVVGMADQPGDAPLVLAHWDGAGGSSSIRSRGGGGGGKGGAKGRGEGGGGGASPYWLMVCIFYAHVSIDIASIIIDN